MSQISNLNELINQRAEMIEIDSGGSGSVN